MTIKIIPEKISTIKNHSTRKKIKNLTYDSKNLISIAVNQLNIVEYANKELKKFNNKKLENLTIVYYSQEKIIFETINFQFKSYFPMIKEEIIELLRTKKIFSLLVDIKIQQKILIDKTKKKPKIKENKIGKIALEKIKKMI